METPNYVSTKPGENEARESINFDRLSLSHNREGRTTFRMSPLTDNFQSDLEPGTTILEKHWRH